MLCGQCQADNRKGRRFCAVCGAPLSAACPDCGFENEPGENFCGGCGRPTADGSKPVAKTTVTAPPDAQGERRPVTVLFADIAGFTALTARLDAEEIHRLLGRFFETVDGLVAQYGGSIDKHIGDNVMAVFGAPIAHGDDPARAVRAAIAIHEAMPGLSASLGSDLRVHVGIASGQVVASDTGSSHHREYTVTGDTVNLASRLADMAGPGETLISNAVYRAVEMLSEVAEAGETTVKGFAAPVRVWRLVKLADVPSGRARLPFVGRQAVLAQFRGILSGSRESGDGQALLVRGEPGIGKTRLIEEVAALAECEGYSCHKGLVLDFGAGMGLGAITAIVRSLLDLSSGAERETLSAAARVAVDDGAIEPDQNVFLNDLLGLPQPADLNAVYEAMDNETRLAGKRAVLTRLIKSASAKRPIALFVEDIHWADGASLSYLAASAAALSGCPAVLVMTSRVEGDPLDSSWRAAARGVSLATIDLQPLRRDESIALAAQLLDASNRFALNCIERANGNPLFLEQLLRNGEESEDENVPDSIQSIVMARIDRLDPGDKRALQAASVVGQRFGLDLLRHLLDDGKYDCTGLLEHALLRPDGDGYLFGHALIRDTVVASLLKSFRSRLHLRAAEWFADRDAVLFAEHLDLAGDDQAPRAYLDAARAEAAEYRFDRVLELVGRGLELARDPADRCALVCQRGDFLRDLGRVEESIATFREARELAGDDVGRCRALIGLASGMRLTDKYEGALAALDEAEAAAMRQSLDLERAHIHHLRGNLIFPLGRIEECRGEHEKALELARRSGSVEFEAASLGGLGDAAYASGRMRTAHDFFRQCMDVCRQHGLSRVEAANRSMVGWTLMYMSDLASAIEEGRATADAAARLGRLRAEVGGRHCVASALLEFGDYEGALRELDRSLLLTRKLGAGRFEAQCMCLRAAVFAETGQRPQARRLLEDALPFIRKTGIRFLGPYILGCLSRFIADPKSREEALDEAERILADGAVGHNFLTFYREAMHGALERGEWDQALRYADALQDYTRAEPLPWSDFFIARTRALVANGKGVEDASAAAELARLHKVGQAAGFRTSLPAIEEALAKQQAAE